jgi:hypothetical protein
MADAKADAPQRGFRFSRMIYTIFMPTRRNVGKGSNAYKLQDRTMRRIARKAAMPSCNGSHHANSGSVAG